MRIVMVTEALGDAFGQERVVRDSTALLRAAGHEVFFLAAHHEALPREGEKLVEGLYQVQSLTPLSRVRRLHGEALTFVEKIRPDLVHFIDVPDYRLTRELVKRYPAMMTAHTVAPTCPASGRFIEGRAVCTEKSGWRCLVYNKRYHCLDGFKNDLRRLHAIQNYLLKRSALEGVKIVAAISRYVERTLVADGWSPEKVRLVFDPVSVPLSLSPARDLPKNLLVTAARLVPMKGIDYCLRALSKIKGVEWTYWICGEGPARSSLEAIVRELGLGDRVRFLGATPYGETSRIIAGSRALLQGNLGPEGFGLSVAEASAMGVPIVAFHVPALDEIVAHEESGLLARPADIADLSRCLETVLTDDKKARAMGERGRVIIRQRFSPESHLEATLAAYGACVGSPATHRSPGRAATRS